jgi:hypothetical protein
MIAGIWASTALLVFALTRFHPSTLTTVSLTVSEFSFNTNAGRILSDSYAEQLIVTGITELQIRGNTLRIAVDDRAPTSEGSLKLAGDPSFSCAFYHVRSARPELVGPSRVSLVWTRGSDPGSLSLKSHGAINGHITSQPATNVLRSGFSCTQSLLNGSAVRHVDGQFSESGGDSISFAGSSDVKMDFRGAPALSTGDTQIPVVGQIRLSSVQPGVSAEEKTTLLAPPQGETNEVVFDDTRQKLALSDADLLVIDPDANYYLKSFKVNEGITLRLGGSVEDLKVGPGSAALPSRMPSVLDRLDTQKRILGLVPALAALIVGLLEKMKVFPEK